MSPPLAELRANAQRTARHWLQKFQRPIACLRSQIHNRSVVRHSRRRSPLVASITARGVDHHSRRRSPPAGSITVRRIVHPSRRSRPTDGKSCDRPRLVSPGHSRCGSGCVGLGRRAREHECRDARTQIAKYIPGNIFHFIGRHAMGRRFGFGHTPMVSAAVLEGIGLILAASLLALVGALVWLEPRSGLAPAKFAALGAILLLVPYALVYGLPRLARARRMEVEARRPPLLGEQQFASVEVHRGR